MPGPLPDPEAERRNAPTIPSTKLPAGGRRGPIPALPPWRELGAAGMAWWEWAWRTPQACAWDDGQLVKVADRASLEDDLIAIRRVDEVETFLVEIANADELRQVRAIVFSLAALVTGRLNILGKISDLDDRLGLSPKGRDQLRMKIVADEDYYPKDKAGPATKASGSVTPIDGRRQRSIDAS